MRANVGSDLFHDLAGRRVGDFLASLERDVGVDGVALDVVFVADDRRLGNGWVAADGALDLGGTEVVAADDDYVVNTAGDPVVAVLVASAAVAAEVLTREPREVGVENR